MPPEGRKMLGSIPKELHSRLKKLCVDADVNIRVAVEESIEEWCEKTEARLAQENLDQLNQAS